MTCDAALEEFGIPEEIFHSGHEEEQEHYDYDQFADDQWASPNECDF